MHRLVPIDDRFVPEIGASGLITPLTPRQHRGSGNVVIVTALGDAGGLVDRALPGGRCEAST